ncbi:DUF4031 domain-containing protein [Catenulispora rubra]|uniref:DUF4031 domain-containing protein n=1 Tax=Catenulispora rubra TaxID=280293 RepID=UPI00189284C4|nr:DUF4031 domain-containing protein [Catenulispora rubra]
MTVYVDDLGCPATVGGLNARWSHLIADDAAELHAFADRLGLRREWFQDPTVNGKPKAAPGTRAAENWHYDVTASKRAQAIRLGAVAVSYRDLPAIINARYETRRQAEGSTS